MTFDHNSSNLETNDHNNEPSSSKLVPNVSPSADTNAPSLQELDFLSSPLFKEYLSVGDQKSTAEPKNIKEAMADHAWIEEIQEELHQFDQLEVWELVDKPFGKTEEGIDFEESFAPVARLKVAKYAIEILKKDGLDKCDSIGTPMATKPKLDADLCGLSVDQTKYKSMIGSLMYLTSSRPDLVQAYPKDSGFELTAFSDVDHAGCLDTRKSTYEGIQFLGEKLVSWMSNKQDCTAMRLSVSHRDLMQPRATLPYQAHQCSLPLYQGTDRFEYLVRRLGMRCLTPAELEVLANEIA
ncbi:hypothetical protein Tco_0673570 [Tanacetum coccineum]